MKKEIKKLKEELHAELTKNILPFWLIKAIDTENGGFFGHIQSNGKTDLEAGKGGVLNARILWTFSASYQILENPAYLEAAKWSYHYIVNHFLDKKFGGSYWELDYQGRPINKRKQIYGLAFTLYGLVAYYRITKNTNAIKYAISLFKDIEKHSFDSRRNGYFEAFTREWKPIDDLRLSEKDQNENKTMNTHLHLLEAYTDLYRVWKNDELKKQLKNLVELFLDRFVNEQGNLNLFFDDDWNLKSDLVSFGHDIESSWLIQEAAEVLEDEVLIKKAREKSLLIVNKNMEGLDSDGGLFYEFYPAKGDWDKEKHWWPQAEAIVGYYNAYQLTGDEIYLKTAVNSWKFIQKFIIDKKNGEWHWSVNEKGVPTKKGEKAGFWKCPYHNSRACLEIITRN